MFRQKHQTFSYQPVQVSPWQSLPEQEQPVPEEDNSLSQTLGDLADTAIFTLAPQTTKGVIMSFAGSYLVHNLLKK
jgi:hypothetical protein